VGHSNSNSTAGTLKKMPRKTTGCWTCRARKKKCDDARPACSACTLRSITCYGYDTKPIWMDGGPAEKDMMDAVQRHIKESYRLRRTRRCKFSGRNNDNLSQHGYGSGATQGSPVESPSSASAWPEQKSGLTTDDAPARLQLITPPYCRDCCVTIKKFCDHKRCHLDLHCPHSTCICHPRNADPSPPSLTPISFTEAELNLIMYYLDHIFPRIAPFFRYSAADNGRGWLLNLFLRIRPLYSAVICLSACDKAQFVLGPLTDVPQPYHDLEMQHLQSVADLRDHLDQLATKTGASQTAAGVEALVCIIHLIYFEVCRFRFSRSPY
jgi:C6 transcription factor Pro1